MRKTKTKLSVDFSIAGSSSKTAPHTNKKVFVAVAISAMGGLLFGYDLGVMAGAMLFIKEEFSLSAEWQEAIVSSLLVGCLVGASFAGVLADALGRRKALRIAAAGFVLGAIGTSLAPSIIWLIGFWGLAGVFVGVVSLCVPLYISEIAPAHLRGKLVSANQFAIALGIFLAFLVDYLLSGSDTWRWMIGVGAIPAILFAVGLIFVPESPRWLASHGFTEQAKQVLRHFLGQENVAPDLAEITHSLSQQKGHWSELLGPQIRPAMILGIVLAIAQQITGINTVIYYAPTLFKAAGFSSNSAAILASVGVGAVNLIMTVVAIVLIDRLGRRPLLLISLAGMVLSLLVLGIGFELPAELDRRHLITILSLTFFVGSFAIGMGPIVWLVLSEIYPLRLRGRAMSLGTAANWAFNLIMASTFLTLIRTMGKAETFWLYGLISAAAWIFVFFKLPETKGRTLEDIEDHWRVTK
jgi:SP family galactose:H+ symporter-like MFS transporter